jgi:hypothetical protein
MSHPKSVLRAGERCLLKESMAQSNAVSTETALQAALLKTEAGKGEAFEETRIAGQLTESLQ